MNRAELMALHEAARPGVGNPKHQEAWEEFACQAWWSLPGVFEEMDRLRAKLSTGETPVPPPPDLSLVGGFR